MSSMAHAQKFYDLNTIQSIEITFAQSNWDQLLDAAYAGSGDYIMAQSVSINGVTFDSVGVKYKGNSTYAPNQVKNPFHIELDTYKDLNYEGYRDIKLSNVSKDPSFLREVLSYQILRQYMDAPLSNYAKVYVNGTLIGLYVNSESVTKKFAQSRFYSKNNAFFKCNPPAGAGQGTTDFPNLVYLGQDSAEYYAAYEMKSDKGWAELIDLCDTLVNHTSDIEKILDVDRALWMLAFDNILVNLDSYIGAFAQNYYLYRDDFGRFLPVVWDLNESFGRFSSTGSGNLSSTTAKQQMSHLLHLNDANFPLIQKLLSVPLYRRMYIAHCKTILLENFDNNSYYNSALGLKATIDAAVQQDVNKFFTYANFNANITTDVTSGGGPGGGATPGITNLMNGRKNYLLGLSDFTQVAPEITNIAYSNQNPVLYQPLTITASITTANAVYIGYRTILGAPFSKIQMFDDGAHNDGAAGDGVFGAAILIESTSTQFFIYAENNTAGKFSPVRAEHEYHTINAVVGLGDLVINEFMASNEHTVADQDGEYDDWIELYNNGNVAINLERYHLSDDANNLTKWTFPPASIAGNGYLIIWADGDDNQTGLHANFKSSATAESIYLVNPNGEIVDRVVYGVQTTDVSFGRFPNGTGAFQAMSATFNAENVGTIGTSNQSLENAGFAIYPNPANNFTILSSQNTLSNDLKLQLSNVAGQIVLEKDFDQNSTSCQLQTENLADGIYFLTIRNNDLAKVFKVFICH